MEDAFAVWEEVNPDVRVAYTKLLEEDRPKRSYICPKGYKREGDTDKPIYEVQRLLVQELWEVKYRQSRSLRVSIDKITPIFNIYDIKIPGPDSLNKIFMRIEKSLGLRTTQEEYVSARRKMAMEIKEKTGKVPLTKDLKAEYAKVKYREEKAKLEKLRRQAKSAEVTMAKQARKAGVSGNKLTEDVKEAKARKRAVVSSDNVLVDEYLALIASGATNELLMEAYLKAMDSKAGREVAFLPTPKQYLFLSANEDFVLYGGAAGGGKSYAILFDAVRYAHLRGYRGVIIRRSMPELRELIDISREVYPSMFKGAKYNTQEKTWRFPSGAILEFGFLDNPSDKYQYQGKQYAWVGFDELGLQQTPEGFDYLKTRLRTTLPIKPTIRCTANPGSLWVKERFIDPAPPNTTFRDTVGLTYRFIPSLVSDNPYIYQNGDGQYVKMLSSMSEVERKQLLEGDWTVSDDSAFPEFDLEAHVIPGDTFIPKHWNRFAGIDYGYSDNSAVVWCAVNPENGQVVVYKELAESKLTGTTLAQAVLREEADELVPVDHVVDWSVWNQTGHIGPTIGQSMQRAGLRMRKADKNRVGGKEQIHSRLTMLDDGETPGIVFLDTCPKIIRELRSLKRAEKTATQNVEDIKQTRLNGNHNDLYDALRYALMSRPRKMTYEDRLIREKSDARWGRINNMFN